jgi:hypothetical protein
MEQNRPSEIPSALLAGRLEGISLPDLLWAMCRCHSTGVLRMTRDEIEKAVYIEDGQIVFASSSDPDDRLGELFLRGGIVTIDQLEDALCKLHTGKRLGTLLVEAESLNPEELIQGVLAQVESIVLDLFEWEEGDYRFDEGPLPTEEVITLNMKTSELLMRGIRQLRSFSRIRRSVGATQKTYGLTEGWQSLLDGVTLTAGEESLVERLADGDVSIEEICREVFLSNYEIYQTIWALKILGVVEEREEPWMAPSDVIQKGSLNQVDFSELLVRLGRGEETGVLYVTRGEHERSFHVSGGRCIFATSNDPDDGLLSYLLQRGVISLQDREETAKRLLSNKRVGTILREIGVIDEHDLNEMVREQLSEIVYDTFRWTDAEYAFVPGPLPTVEEITLEEDLDALVARGIRRVGSWSRVWQGCGGLDVTLELKPTYLSVLDAMGAGPDEWQVIAALKVPRTPREICRESNLANFRVCQIVWTMRALGGVEAVGADHVAEIEDDEYVGSEAEEIVAAPEDPQRIDVVELDEPESPARQEVEVAEQLAGPEEESFPMVGEPEASEPVEIPVECIPQNDPIVEERTEEDWAEEERAHEARIDAAVDDSIEPLPVAEEAETARFQAEPSPEAAQFLSHDSLEAAINAMNGVNTDVGIDVAPSSPDATQVIPREVVEAAVAGETVEPTESLVDEPEVEIPEDEPEESTLEIVRGAVDEALQVGRPADENTDSAVERAVAGQNQADEQTEDDGWELPQDVDQAIARFNAAQRVVYRTVRAEVGAGAPNFIRACCLQLENGDADPTAGVDLHADGSWDSEGLRRAIRALRLEDPWTAYRKLIDTEIDVLRQHIGDARAVELKKQVELVGQTDAAR